MLQTLSADLETQAGDLTELPAATPAQTRVETWYLYYEGPAGQPFYYEVSAQEYGDGHFEVYVHYLDQVSNPWATVPQAERFILRHRHYICSGHLPGTCSCLSD